MILSGLLCSLREHVQKTEKLIIGESRLQEITIFSFLQKYSTLWLHDLTLAQHPTVKAAAIFRDKFCLIGFVFVITAVIFILYYLSFMMKALPFRVLCWMIKKVFTGPKVNCAREFNAWRSPTSAVPRLPLPTFLCLLMPILAFFMYNMNSTQKGMTN